MLAVLLVELGSSVIVSNIDATFVISFSKGIFPKNWSRLNCPAPSIDLQITWPLTTPAEKFRCANGANIVPVTSIPWIVKFVAW